jgi:predicted glycosyltransferase
MTQIEQKIEKYLDSVLTDNPTTFPDRESAFAYVAMCIARMVHEDYVCERQLGIIVDPPNYYDVVAIVYTNLHANSSSETISYDPD